ncbi:hypothetical protein AN958_07633 [Leucoagaricus sp. SymC.cos]|nr:hypothetical protein AN958_07633 [Leucoagaricus sp. SymC.cos]
MSRPHRRSRQQQQPQQYAVVPQTSPSRHGSYSSNGHQHYPYQHQQVQPDYQYQQYPQQYQQQLQYTSHVGGPRSPPPPRLPTVQRHESRTSGRTGLAMGVASGAVGGGYGPYAVKTSNPSYEKEHVHVPPPPPVQPTQSIPQYLYDKDPDLDDALHDPRPDPSFDSCTIFSLRGWVNAVALVLIVVGLVTLFAGYPIIRFFTHPAGRVHGFNIGGINGSGQIPDLNLPSLIDPDTPFDAYTRTGNDGKKYNLVFSDEFETDGRSFYPGDDPYWEAVDLHYWPTGDLEWYDPGTITTAGGKLVITISEKTSHNLNFESGMLTSWNKFCFNTGYVEMSISMPGSPKAPGLWPGAWSLGNLGRAGYGATTEGMWPYSYDSCDLGTFPNQTARDGTPEAATTGGKNDGPLSFLPGQKLSACTCPGSDHPGPSVTTGRGAPEIDIIETQVDVSRFVGQVSQSFQTAPYNYKYQFDNSSSATTIYDPSITRFNTYTGGIYQQAISALTDIDSAHYNGQGYAAYGYEWCDGKPTWTATSASTGPDSISEVSQRIIPEEPMYLIMNLGLAPSFQLQDYKHLQFPSKMYIDYVRVYQREGVKDGVTCNPPNRPTTDYIQKHIQAYTNPNLTTWASAGNTFPRNRLYDGC